MKHRQIKTVHTSLILRWGVECYAEHGGYWTHHDRYNPGVLQKHKFENSMSIDKSAWGIRSNIHVNKILSMDELVYEIVSTGIYHFILLQYYNNMIYPIIMITVAIHFPKLTF